MQERKTTNNYNDSLKFRIVKEMCTKCAMKSMHKSNKICQIWHAIFSRQSSDGPWRTAVNTDSKEKSVAACMRMDRLVWEWSCFVDRKKSADHPERVCFLSLRAKEVMMCGAPFCFFRWTSIQGKNPRVGIFYFACFSKNGRNHSGEWFDFEKKVLKTSIKSI